jgi:sulfite exporter TauE/SafE
MPTSIYNITGWHTEASATKERINLNPKRFNFFRVLGYFPVGGILIGLADIGTSKDEEKLATRIYGIVRGILEIIGLGIVFLIPDIAVSVHRHFCSATPHNAKV